jgi:outer membrane protein assembly factor BamA
VVTYRFVELFLLLPSLGLKFSDESGVSVGAGVKMPNFLGRGILMSARFLVGGMTELEFWLDDPWWFGNHWGYRVEYYHRQKENLTVDFNERTDEVYLWTGPRVGKHGNAGAHFSYIDMRADRDGVTLGPDRRDRTARLGLYLGYESLDSYLNTTSGWYNQVQYTNELAFLKKTGGTYGQWDLDFRRYLSLGGRHVLAGFSLTTLRDGTLGREVAPWELFAVGGTNTVRGWPFAARQGKNQMLNTVEYRFTLLEPRFWDLPLGFRYRGGLQLAAFVDYGIGWDRSADFAADNFISGYGAGLRLLIPIVGVARLDVGFGEDALHKVYLHLGSFEKATMARRRVR